MRVHVVLKVPYQTIDSVRAIMTLRHGAFTESEAASIAHLSRQQFSRQFKKVYGITFRKLQMLLKMEEGARLLVETKKSIAAIAEELGYVEPAKFEHSFRRTFAITASQYRRNHLVS